MYCSSARIKRVDGAKIMARSTWVDLMGTQNAKSIKNVVAYTWRSLYDEQKGSKSDRRRVVIAATRAVILAALAGGALWYLLWKLTVYLLG
jgi:hypothetical protein